MKNLFFVIFLLSFFMNEVHSQSVFHSSYEDFNNSIQLTSTSFTRDSDILYISGGNNEMPSKIFFLSVDSIGEIIYSRKFNTNDFLSQSINIQKSGNSLFLLGYIRIPVEFHYYTLISKIDANGNLNWFKYFSPFIDNVPTSFLILEDGSILITGYLKEGNPQVNKIFILKLTASGNLSLVRKIEIGYESAAYSIIKTLDGALTLTGYCKETSSSNPNLICIKIDYNLNIVFSKSYTNIDYPLIGRAIKQNSQGDYIIAADITTPNLAKEIILVKTDVSGNLIWSKQFQGNMNDDDIPSSLFVDDNDNIYLTGITTDFNNVDVQTTFLIKTNTNGDLSWCVSYFDSTTTEGIYNTKGNQILGTNNGFNIIGERANSSGTMNNLILISADSLGNSDCFYSGVNVNSIDVVLNTSIPIPAVTTFSGDMVSYTVSLSDYNLIQKYPCEIPVELTSFQAFMEDGKIRLNWTTASEINNKGFEIERKLIDSKSSDFKTIGFIQGNGTSTKENHYSFYDNNLNFNKAYYLLKQLDYNGSYQYSKIIEVEITLPKENELCQNYPNPFNPTTTIKYSINSQQFVSLKVYDVLGNEVATLVNEEQPAGNYSVEFNGSNLASGISAGGGYASGVYFYQLKTGDFTATKKLILLK